MVNLIYLNNNQNEKMRNYILFLIVLVFSFAFISKTVSAVTCTCLNCTDCTEKLNNASCDEVLLSET